MLTWAQRLTDASRLPLMLWTSATTGLKPDKGDKLLVVRGKTPRRDGAQISLAQEVPMQDFEKSQQYHRMNSEQFQRAMLPPRKFASELSEVLPQYTMLSYNRRFQESFIRATADNVPVSMVELYPIVAVAESGAPMPGDIVYDSIYELEKRCRAIVGTAMTFASFCSTRSYKQDTTKSAPEANLLILTRLWDRLEQIPLTMV